MKIIQTLDLLTVSFAYQVVLTLRREIVKSFVRVLAGNASADIVQCYYRSVVLHGCDTGAHREDSLCDAVHSGYGSHRVFTRSLQHFRWLGRMHLL